MKITRTVSLLYFINLALILNYLQGPYFLLLGLFQLESVSAAFIVLGLMAVCAVAGYFSLRRSSATIPLTKYFTSFMLINSLVNLAALLFIYVDIAGFLQRAAGQGSVLGFAFLQLAAAFVNLWLRVAVPASRKHYRKR